MSLPDLQSNSSLERLLDYHRLLRLVEEDGRSVLDDEAMVRVARLIRDRIRQLELPAAVELDRARELRG